MRILPVLDLLAGQVVRGIAGRRQEYRPIVSRLTTSTAPLEVALAFRDHFGLTDLYLADLDAIAGKPPALPICAALLQAGFDPWVDAGIGPGGTTLDSLAKLGVHNLVAGLESLDGPGDLHTFLTCFGPSNLVFSLDLKAGQPLGNVTAWQTPDPWTIAQQAIQLGVQRILVLDLAGVGTGQGNQTVDLCARLRASFPLLEITTGGGVRGADDLAQLQLIGVNNVLVASALHDGRMCKEDFLNKFPC
jgi:HisA/HisF family protein